MSRIDKQECSSVIDIELRDVAKLDNLKKKFFLISIVFKILSLLSIYKSLQYKLRKSLSCMSNIYQTSIDYFRLLIIAKYSCIIVIYINLNVYKQIITNSPEKKPRSYL